MWLRVSREPGARQCRRDELARREDDNDSASESGIKRGLRE